MESKEDTMIYEQIIGKTIVAIHELYKGSDKVYFVFSDGSHWEMYHQQDCCENVEIDDIVGDQSDLIGQPLLIAEENTNSSDFLHNAYCESQTWTFYKFATIKGYVDIKWYGESNGYYSEDVTFKEVKKADKS